MIRARTMEEYRDLIQQALFETADLRASAEFDEEYMGDSMRFTDPLEAALRDLEGKVAEDTYTFGGEDLAFMPIVVATAPSVLPFRQLLMRINDTHRKGLEPE
ncbi:MAG: hypothetical protein U9R74_07410 [Pseudomonadota bacterium]|nr:hypothetical protein [Pseudomonadota bacterium]